MQWSSSLDIWQLGCLFFQLVARQELFTFYDNLDSEGVTKVHLEEIVAMLGPPPVDFLARDGESYSYFNADGTPNANMTNLLPTFFRDRRLAQLPTGPQRAIIQDFLFSMLKWKPEERHTARQLLGHPFFQMKYRAVRDEEAPAEGSVADEGAQHPGEDVQAEVANGEGIMDDESVEPDAEDSTDVEGTTLGGGSIDMGSIYQLPRFEFEETAEKAI